MPGTAAYRVPAAGALAAVGVLSSPSMGISWSEDGLTSAPCAAGPLFNAAWSDWNTKRQFNRALRIRRLDRPSGEHRVKPAGKGEGEQPALAFSRQCRGQ